MLAPNRAKLGEISILRIFTIFGQVTNEAIDKEVAGINQNGTSSMDIATIIGLLLVE